MDKREKVIKGLENIVSDMQEEIDEWRDYSDSELSHGLTCDCEWWYNTAQMLKDALALLKAQEPTKFQIKTTISNVDIPKDIDEEQFMAVLSQQYAALAKLYGEELPTYSPS